MWVAGLKKEDKRSGRERLKGEDPRPRLEVSPPSQARKPAEAVKGNHKDQGPRTKVTGRARTTSATPLDLTYIHDSFATVVSREISASQQHLPFLDIFLPKTPPFLFHTTPFHYRQHVRQGRSSHSLQPAPIRYPTAGSITECASRISSRPGHRLATERQCGARSGRRGRRPVVNGFDVRCAPPVNTVVEAQQDGKAET